MKNYPEIVKKEGIVYYLKNIYKNFALYETKTGIRTCFDRFDCALIPVNTKKTNNRRYNYD